MNILTVDTSSSCSSVALSSGTKLLGECLLGEDRCHSGRLLGSISQLLQAAGLTPDTLDLFAVSLGPGSFTGVRVGIATVKGLALATGKPVVGFSSLALLAMNLPCTPHLIAPMFDARKSEVYAALYRLAVLPEPVVPDAVLSPARFLSCIDSPTLFLGDGALRYRDLIRSTVGDLALFPPWNADLPRASAGAVIALHAALLQNFTPLAELNPTYLRASEAELARRQRESP